MPKTVERDAAYVVQNVTYSELRPLAGAPADGDDYTYTPLPHRQPLIPPQWVSVSEYRWPNWRSYLNNGRVIEPAVGVI